MLSSKTCTTDKTGLFPSTYSLKFLTLLLEKVGNLRSIGNQNVDLDRANWILLILPHRMFLTCLLSISIQFIATKIDIYSFHTRAEKSFFIICTALLLSAST